MAQPASAVRIVVRPLGSVLPIGFLAFGVGAFVTSAFALGWIAPHESRQVYTLLLTFVVPVQALAAIFAFLSRDTPGGTTLSILGATWCTLGVAGLSLEPGATSQTLGVFLLADGVVIAVLAVAALAGNPAFTVILGVACVRFAMNGTYELTARTGFAHAAGWIGIILAVVAAYAAIAFLLEDAKQRPVLPMLRHGPSGDAVESDFADQIEGIEREPGVRANL
jgi:succinate-acetate transporter protein